MTNFRWTAIAVSCATLLVWSQTADAAPKQKLTYDQAWKACQTQVNKLAGDQHSQRHTRGAACMKRYGYRI